MSKIHIEALHKTYASGNGRVRALENIDLSIRQNEFVTLVGPSGVRKSRAPRMPSRLPLTGRRPWHARSSWNTRAMHR